MAVKAGWPRSVHGCEKAQAENAERRASHEGVQTPARPCSGQTRRGDGEEPAGILIPDTVKEKAAEGEVLAVGPGARDDTGRIIPPDVKVGERVLFSKWAGTDVLIGGEDRLILNEADILGVIEASRA